MEVKRITEVTPIIMPKDVRIVRLLFLRMDRRLDLINSSSDGLNILNADLAIFDNDYATCLAG